MLNSKNLQKFIDKFQTNRENVIREYLQHLFLSSLYKIKGSEKLLFKGGTALRFAFQSPRFSEDLDFTCQNIYHYQEIDDLFLNTLVEMEKIGISIYYQEAKPTTGGYLGLIHYEMFDTAKDMKFEISLRKGKKVAGELINIISEFIPSYTLTCLPPRELVAGKMAALLSRYKPRDYYDLYFMLRHHELNKYVDKSKLSAVLKSINVEKIDFKKELSIFLPTSHQLILRNFEDTLRKEISGYL